MTGRTPRAAAAALAAMLVACATAAPRPEVVAPRRTPVALAALPAVRYPSMLQSANIEGDVVLDVVVDSAGRVAWGRSTVVKSSHDLFTEAARSAFHRATWTPATEGGVPTAGTWRDTIEFRIQDDRVPCEAARAHHRRVCAQATSIGVARPMSAAEREELLDTLRAGRERWRNERPRRYRLEVTENAGMIAYVGPQFRLVTEVVGDSVRHVRRTRVAEPRLSWRATTVERLFAWAEDHVRTTDARVDVLELDPRYGFPRRLHSDRANTTDSETDVRVAAFTPVR